MKTPKHRKDKFSERWRHRPWAEWPENERAVRSVRKDTKKWCRGIPGRDHEYEKAVYFSIRDVYTCYIEKCQHCGRHGQVIPPV